MFRCSILPSVTVPDSWATETFLGKWQSNKNCLKLKQIPCASSLPTWYLSHNVFPLIYSCSPAVLMGIVSFGQMASSPTMVQCGIGCFKMCPLLSPTEKQASVNKTNRLEQTKSALMRDNFGLEWKNMQTPTQE